MPYHVKIFEGGNYSTQVFAELEAAISWGAMEYERISKFTPELAAMVLGESITYAFSVLDRDGLAANMTLWEDVADDEETVVASCSIEFDGVAEKSMGLIENSDADETEDKKGTV